MAKPNIKKEISIAENLAEERLTLIIKKEEKDYANVGSVLHTDTIKEKSSFGSDSIDSTKLRGSTSLQSDNIQKDQLDTSSDYGDYDSVFRPRHYPPKYKIGSTIDEIVVDRKLNYDRKSDRGEITATTSDEEDNADRMLTHPLEESISQGLRIDNQAFPPTIGEFFSQKPQKCPRYYQFPAGTSNKFRISIATLDRLIKKGQSLQEVSLSMKKAPLPDVTKLSREEIVLMLANRNLLNQMELLKALDDNHIEHIESFYTKNVYVRNCDWNTLYKISHLVSELNCDLTVSGGGDAEYAMDVVVGDPQLIGPEQQHDTLAFHEQIISSCPPRESDRSVKVGIIDSGCSSTLYNRIVGDGNVVMHHSMIDATHPDIAEVPYRDCFSPRGIAKGHGTAVVEIVSKCVVAKTEIYVVSLGYPINPMNFGDALLALFERGVTVFNFSLTIELDDETKETIDVMKCKGVVFVAAAGNRNMNDWSWPDHITSDLQDGKSIMVGSHNNSDEISEFSIGKCEADVCCLGENIYVENPWHQIRQGTSFATPHVTAVVANFVSHFQHDINETAMWEFLTESSSYLVCHCKRHGGKRIKLKLNPSAVMQHALTHVPEAL